MKICQDHWDALRAQIKHLGLYHLVAQNPEDMMEIVEHGAYDQYHFDPLLMANNLIWSNALETGGLYLLLESEVLCPLCELDKHGGNVDDWIHGASQDALHEARRLKLVPTLQ